MKLSGAAACTTVWRTFLQAFQTEFGSFYSDEALMLMSAEIPAAQKKTFSIPLYFVVFLCDAHCWFVSLSLKKQGYE